MPNTHTGVNDVVIHFFSLYVYNRHDAVKSHESTVTLVGSVERTLKIMDQVVQPSENALGHNLQLQTAII